MRYVDAAYTIALLVLVLYAASLLLRRRRLARAAAIAQRDAVSSDPAAPSVPSEQPAAR